MAISRRRRGRSIAMTPAELDEFLAQERTCRARAPELLFAGRYLGSDSMPQPGR